MGHHPPIGVQEVVQSSASNGSGGISTVSWFFILVGIVIVVYLIYGYFKKK